MKYFEQPQRSFIPEILTWLLNMLGAASRRSHFLQTQLNCTAAQEEKHISSGLMLVTGWEASGDGIFHGLRRKAMPLGESGPSSTARCHMFPSAWWHGKRVAPTSNCPLCWRKDRNLHEPEGKYVFLNSGWTVFFLWLGQHAEGLCAVATFKVRQLCMTGWVRFLSCLVMLGSYTGR